MPAVKNFSQWLILIALVGFGAISYASSSTPDYFTVQPTVAAPGQFVHFNWNATGAKGFSVKPPLNAEADEDGEVLPASASNYIYVAPLASTTYTATAVPGTNGQPVRATLTIVPLTLQVSSRSVAAGQPVTLNFSGPNNGSTFALVTLPENSSTPLVAEHCNGAVCTGSFVTPPLGASRTFMIKATGPYQGQGYSQRVAVNVNGGMSLACSARPMTPAPGQGVTINWHAANAASVRIDHGVGEVSPSAAGSTTVHPSQSTTYTCTATDRFGDHLFAETKVVLSTGDVSNLNHIIYLLQENRAFDNIFGALATYRVQVDNIPGAQLADVNDLHTLPPGYMIMNPQGQSFPPFHARTVCTEGMNPNWNETHTDMDLVGGDWMHLTQSSQYLMDKFLNTAQGYQYDPTGTRPLGYYDWTDLPFYYELAAQFNTSDTFYSPAPSATSINRMYLFAGTSYGNIFTPNGNNLVFHRPTFFRALQNAGVTWRYYYQDNSVYLTQWSDYQDPAIQANVVSIQEYYNILQSSQADQQLPQVIFIERASATGYDDHPGNNLQKGAQRVQQIITPLLASTAWPDSAFIMTYDEGGGTFDHVAPILVSPPDDKVPGPFQPLFFIHGLFNVTGFRVPVMLVSPWSKAHFVWHIPTDFTSTLKLIETRFNMPPLTHRDRDAADLTDPVNGPFDFNSPEMLQVPPLPTQPTNGTCDYSLESYPQ
jgi:phospholipase C